MANFTSLTTSPYANWMDRGFEVGTIHQVIKTATQITILSSEPGEKVVNRVDYFGKFTYVGESVSGALDSFTRTDSDGPVRYTVENLSLDVAKLSTLILSGTDAQLIPIALAGDDVFVGNEWSNLLGYGGNDTYISKYMYFSAFDGGDGIDTAVFNENRANFQLKNNFLNPILTAQPELSVQKGTGGSSVSLKNVERIEFTDTALALDISGNAGQAYRLYRAAFDRTPDANGLGFWINAMDEGATLQSVATGFVNSAEFKALFSSNPENKAVLTAFYKNVLHRTPDQSGFDFWLKSLETGLSLNQMLVEFSESAENKAQVIGAIENGIEYHPYG